MTTGAKYAVRLRPDALGRITRALDVSRARLARECGVAESTLWRAEAGDRPGGQTIAALLAVSGLPFEDLFEIEETS